MELTSFLATLLTSAGLSVALSTALIFLARSWISERLQQSIRHEYDLKLAHLNAQLKNESEKNLYLLRNSVEQESERVRLATTSVSQTQRIAIEKRLSSLEVLWDGVLAARNNIPPVLNLMDILTVDEYVSAKDHRDFKALAGQVSHERIAAMHTDNVGSRERIRPYVGEYLWALLGTYQAVILRTALLIHMGMSDEKKLNWHLDSGVNQLLDSAFSKNEMDEFKATRIGKINYIQRTFESKILAAMQVVISGEQFGEESIRQANKMEEKVLQLRRSQANS